MGKMPKNENIDAFWDIEDLIPDRIKKPRVSHGFTDTSATEIELGAKAADGGEKIPPRMPERKKAAQVFREYDGSGLISHVKILSWPTAFEFYTKFCRDAARYFSLTHEPCEYVYFFSYMPQYEQMTGSQMSYYLYWREEARKENYLKTDINYLFLYIYEIINLTDRVPAHEGARMLSRLWKTYRRDFRYLDKYLGEWLCDYCLIHGVSPDWEALEAFKGEIAGKVSLPEFYMKDGKMNWSLIEAISSYDYRRSKYYEAHAGEYDLHIPRAVERAVNRVIMMNPDDFGICSMTTSRDSYAGAIVSHRSKFKMEITRFALRKSSGGEQDMKHIFANLIKLAENQIRCAVGIKSRFSPIISDARLKKEILDYFEECLPARIAKKGKNDAEEEAYMALYEPAQKGTADISRALDIERQAWETAELLSIEDEETESVPVCAALPTETFFDPIPSPPEREIGASETASFASCGSEFGFLVDALNNIQVGALCAALDGSFSVYCRKIGRMEENVRGEINEIAMEYVGDMILENDFSIVEDYLEDIRAALASAAED